MYIVKRQPAVGGYHVRPTLGSVKRMMNMKTEGLGISKEFYEKTNVSHPYKSLGGGNMKKVNGLSDIKVKSARTKKYISLNL